MMFLIYVSPDNSLSLDRINTVYLWYVFETRTGPGEEQEDNTEEMSVRDVCLCRP